MEKFNDLNVTRFRYQFDDIELLREYNVGLDNSLIESSSSCSLLGVQKNGKWGWINLRGQFVIPAIYDSGFVECYNGIILLQKNECWGGLYRDTLSTAFHFKYEYLSHAWRDIYVAWSNDRCALIKPVDIAITDYKYKGFSKYNRGNITEYVRIGFLGREVHGDIDLETGRELS
ncbi:MAG: hypothetical protein IJ635_05650 [Bacteroidaceae bacterium]|nr:hypothetical protein [Bacteroidaceae bacterium]